MNSLPEVAMTVIEPGGRRWAQLLNVTWAVRDLLPEIVSRLDLPQRINYELHHARSGRILQSGESLQSVGIVAGEELLLKPVRDKLFVDLMDALYGEAVGYAAKKLWGQVESRLETLFRLDPQFPDPKGLRGTAGRPPDATSYSRGEPAGTTPGPPPPPPSYSTGPSPYAGSPSSTAGPTPAGPQLTPAGPQPTPVGPQPTAAARPRPLATCAIVAVVIGGLLVLALVVGGSRIIRFILEQSTPEPAGVLIPTFEPGGGIIPPIDEPVLGTGDVQMTLRWDNSADLDLHVVDPGGEEIYFGIPTSTSGGQLDVDANGDCSGDPPVENVYWPTGGAPGGTYRVSVVYYGSCDSSGTANYEVTTRINGEVVDVRSGTLSSAGETIQIGEYTR